MPDVLLLRYRTLLLTLFFGFCQPHYGNCIPQKTVVDVGTRSQLFIDRELIYDARSVSFTLHPARKHSAQPLMVGDQPWEGGNIYQGGTVMYDAEERIFKMWYTGHASEYFDRITTLYATSRDGIHWDKSQRGTIPAKNGKRCNAVADRYLPSVIKDPRDPDPTHRYKMVSFHEDRGFTSLVSPDGLHWTETGPGAFLPISYVDDVVTACWSKPHQVFVTFAKQAMPVMGRRRRTIWTSFSHDFVHWSKPEPALVADRRDDYGSRIRAEKARPLLLYPDNYNVMRSEIYGTGMYSAESCLVAFPWIFTATVNIPNVGNQEGPIETQLAVSRDLVHWERPFRTPAIPSGKPGSWDGGMLSACAYAFDYQNEVWMYYWGNPGTHAGPPPGQATLNGGIGLAKWPKDRFVSADGPAAGGTLTTVPVQFAGNRLELNANVKRGGKILVELLDLALNRRKDWPTSAPVTGDDLRHTVQFDGASDVSGLAGQPLVIRFHLWDAELYSFAFRE